MILFNKKEDFYTAYFMPLSFIFVILKFNNHVKTMFLKFQYADCA